MTKTRLQKIKKTKTKPTQKQKQQQNVIVNIHKQTRRKKNTLQKEASPKEKQPHHHPAPSFSFHPVIHSAPVQDNTIGRSIMQNQTRLEEELKKYALASSRTDDIERLTRRFNALDARLSPSTTARTGRDVYTDLSNTGSRIRYVGDATDNYTIPIDGRVSATTGTETPTLGQTKPFLTASGIGPKIDRQHITQAYAPSVLELAGHLGHEEETPSRIKSHLEQQAEDAGIARTDDGNDPYSEANLTIGLLQRALLRSGGERYEQTPPRETYSAFTGRFETAEERQQGPDEVDLDADGAERHGVQQGASLASFKLEPFQTELQALQKIARENSIKTTGKYTNSLGGTSSGILPFETLKQRVAEAGIEIPEVIAKAKISKAGRKPALSKVPLGSPLGN